MVAVEQQIEYYDNGSQYVYCNGTLQKNGESFTIGTVGPAVEVLLTKIRLIGCRHGNPGNITASLYKATAGHIPTGPLLDSCSYVSATIPTSGNNNIDLPFNYDRLVPNTIYVFYIELISSHDNSLLLWHRSSQGYSGGKRVYANPGWFAYTQNLEFAVFGYPKNTIGMTTEGMMQFK